MAAALHNPIPLVWFSADGNLNLRIVFERFEGLDNPNASVYNDIENLISDVILPTTISKLLLKDSPLSKVVLEAVGKALATRGGVQKYIASERPYEEVRTPDDADDGNDYQSLAVAPRYFEAWRRQSTFETPGLELDPIFTSVDRPMSQTLGMSAPPLSPASDATEETTGRADEYCVKRKRDDDGDEGMSRFKRPREGR